MVLLYPPPPTSYNQCWNPAKSSPDQAHRTEMQTQKALTDAAGESGFPTKGGAGHCWLSRVPADTATVSKASAGAVSPQGSSWAGSGRVLGEHPLSSSPWGPTVPSPALTLVPSLPPHLPATQAHQLANGKGSEQSQALRPSRTRMGSQQLQLRTQTGGYRHRGLACVARTGDKGKKGALGQGVTSIPSSEEADHY